MLPAVWRVFGRRVCRRWRKEREMGRIWWNMASSPEIRLWTVELGKGSEGECFAHGFAGVRWPEWRREGKKRGGGGLWWIRANRWWNGRLTTAEGRGEGGGTMVGIWRDFAGEIAGEIAGDGRKKKIRGRWWCFPAIRRREEEEETEGSHLPEFGSD